MSRLTNWQYAYVNLSIFQGLLNYLPLTTKPTAEYCSHKIYSIAVNHRNFKINVQSLRTRNAPRKISPSLDI